MSNTFVKLRRGLVDHLRDGRISAYEYLIETLIIAEADHRTGLWFGSGEKLAAEFDLSARTCRDVLEKLEKKGYIRRFIVPGKRGNYPVLVNKYECRDGAGKEVYLNAARSNDYRHPIYESAVMVPPECRDGAASQEVRTKNKEKCRVQNAHAHHRPRSEQEQREIVGARDRRLEKESETQRELLVGAGPSTAIWEDARRKIAQIAKSKTL